MQNKSNLFKYTIIALTVIVVVLGLFFGVKFYKESRNQQPTEANTSNPIPFQSRSRSASGTVTVVANPETAVVTEVTQGIISTSSDVTVRSRLTQLWDKPVSGFDFVYKDVVIPATTTRVSTSTASSTVGTTTIRSIDEKKTPSTKKTATTDLKQKDTILKNQEYIYIWDRATGNIYENMASTSLVNRLSNTIIPGVQEAYFLDSTSAFIRSLDTDNERIISRYISLTKETATTTLTKATQSYVNQYTKQISFLPDSKKMFYFTEKTGQGTVGNADGSGQTTVIKTHLTEWLSQFVNKTTIAATTKPSAYYPGYLFFINSNGGGNQFIIGERYGFTSLISPDGKKVLFSEIRNDRLELVVYDIKTKSEILLSQATLSEKCTWSSDSSVIYCAIPQTLQTLPYPDVWYQNKTDFADNIWSINPTTGEFAVVVGLQNRLPKTPIDAINLKVSKNKKYLLFQDKYSLSLWRFDL